MKYYKNFQIWVETSPAPRLPSRNYTPAIAVKKPAKVYIKAHYSSPILLDSITPSGIAMLIPLSCME